MPAYSHYSGRITPSSFPAFVLFLCLLFPQIGSGQERASNATDSQIATSQSAALIEQLRTKLPHAFARFEQEGIPNRLTAGPTVSEARDRKAQAEAYAQRIINRGNIAPDAAKQTRTRIVGAAVSANEADCVFSGSRQSEPIHRTGPAQSIVVSDSTSGIGISSPQSQPSSYM